MVHAVGRPGPRRASRSGQALQHLFGRQSLDNLKRFRALGGAQSYPSRTKDVDDVDFSTGSVGLGVAMTAFASLTQDYLAARGAVKPEKMGRMISLLGDAELDEGNIYEALIEACKHDIRNTWWIVDYNRQSLDATTQGGSAACVSPHCTSRRRACGNANRSSVSYCET